MDSYERSGMSESDKKPDYPYQQRAVAALRIDGARIVETEPGWWFCEIRSTLKALRLRRTGEVKRRLQERLAPYVCLLIGEGAGLFVPASQLNALAD